MLVSVPRWFQKELELIDNKYFAVWNAKIKRWQIRLWLDKPSNGDKRDMDAILRKSVVVLTIALRDSMSRDIGYCDLDRRALDILKYRKHLSELAMNKLIRDIENHNQELLNKNMATYEEMVRDATITLYNTVKREWNTKPKMGK